MIKSAKGVEKRKNEVSAIRVTYLSLEGSICFMLEFLLDFRKHNLMILVIIYLFPYQELVFPY